MLSRRRLLGGVLGLALTAPLVGTAWSAPPADTPWEDLVPKDWDPMAGIQLPSRLGALRDGDPEALDLMDRLRKAWDHAPTRGELDNTPVRLSGYVVPLEQVKGEVREFLLVPYFGACIHSPPPPANQIVHVLPAAGEKHAKGLKTMDVVTVQGRIRTQRIDSVMGASGYRIETATLQPYRGPAR